MKRTWMFLTMACLLVLAGCDRPAQSYDSDGVMGKTYGGGPYSHGTAPLEPGAIDAGKPYDGPSTGPANLVGPADPKAGSLSALMGVQARAATIVYVVDRSGGTALYWQSLCEELYRSIGDLYPDQHFAVVLMDKNQALVGPTRDALVPGLKKNQGHAGKFIQQNEPRNDTTPSVALKKAFDLLAGAKGSKVIYLVTDSPTLDTSLGELAASRNKAVGATIVTFMIGDGSPATKRTLEEVAKAGNGTMKQVRLSKGP